MNEPIQTVPAYGYGASTSLEERSRVPRLTSLLAD